MSWLLRLFQHLPIGWSLSRSSPIHYHAPDSHHHCPRKCTPPVHRARGPDLSSLSLQPMQLQAFSSHPPPAKGTVKVKTSMAWSGKRVMKGWRGSFCTGLPQPAEPTTGIRAAPATSWTSLCTGGLRPAQRHGQGGLGSPWVDVQGATLSTQRALAMPCFCHIQAPKHLDTTAVTPKQLEADWGVAPKSHWLCSPYPWLGRGWQGRKRGTCRWHRSLVALLSITQGPQLILLTDPKFFLLTSHPQAEAFLRPGGEDSLIKVFRNAGGWRLGRGGV